MSQSLIVTGDTFSSRDELKQMGARWRPADRSWIVPFRNLPALCRLQGDIGFEIAIRLADDSRTP